MNFNFNIYCERTFIGKVYREKGVFILDRQCRKHFVQDRSDLIGSCSGLIEQYPWLVAVPGIGDVSGITTQQRLILNS
jgi:hypothetical protein